MKIAILGAMQGGFNVAKYGIAPEDEVYYFEVCPNVIMKRQGVPTEIISYDPQLLFARMTELGIEGVINLGSKFHYGWKHDYDLKANLIANGFTPLAVPSLSLLELEFDRWSARQFAADNGLDLLLLDKEGTKAAIKDTASYPCFIKTKAVGDNRPHPVASATGTNWNRYKDTDELWTEPAISNPSILNVNYIICEGSVKLLNAVQYDVVEECRFYGKNHQVVDLNDGFIISQVAPYAQAVATAHPTEKAVMAVQFLVDGGAKYFLENNCHPAVCVPWKGLTDIKTLLSDKATFDADTSTLDGYSFLAKEAVDLDVNIDGLHEIVTTNTDIDFLGVHLNYFDDENILSPTDIHYKMHPHLHERKYSGIFFYLYNGATLPAEVTNLKDKV